MWQSIKSCIEGLLGFISHLRFGSQDQDIHIIIIIINHSIKEQIHYG